jgi:predicted aspartyl protease
MIRKIGLIVLLLTTCQFALADKEFDDLLAKANTGDAHAQNHLGFMYEHGEGVARNYNQAIYWYTKAAEQGNVDAQNNLSAMYDNGKEVPQDLRQAFYWGVKAAEQGDVESQMALGLWYARGKGVEQDYIEAYKWFDLASATGDTTAKKALRGLEQLMTAEQINEAQERARLWKPTTIVEATGIKNADENNSDKNQTKITISKNNGGVYEIPVIQNGVLTIKFIIDSGATEVLLSPDVAFTLIKTGTVKKADFLEGAEYQFADGSSAKSARFLLHSIKIGSKTITNVTCSIANSVDAPLLLGQSALHKLGAYKIDYKTNQISFE